MRTTTEQADALCSLADARTSLVQVLEQIHELVTSLSQWQFVRTPVGPVHSTIGSHVRHSIDHVHAWLKALATDCLDYDDRQRATDVELQRDIALAVLQLLIEQVRGISLDDARKPWTMQAQVTEGGPSLSMQTTALRELVFVLSHTIHHNALIGVMARVHGVALPPGFGYAPATLTYASSHDCTCAH